MEGADPGVLMAQGSYDPALNFDFHRNRWTNLVPLPGLECRRGPFAAYFPPLETVVVVEGCLSSDPYPTYPRMHVFRTGMDKQFVEAMSVGTLPDSRKGGFVCYDPIRRRLLSFFQSGIYGIGLESSRGTATASDPETGFVELPGNPKLPSRWKHALDF